MITSPVIETVAGLLMIFYALALLCAGIVELVATRTKKRAKYLLRGLQDLLDGGGQVGIERPADPRTWTGAARAESEVYQSALAARANRPSSPAGGTAESRPTSVTAPRPSSAPAVTVDKIMGHGLVQPFKQTTATGRLTRNPSYLPSDVFSRVLVDLLDGGAQTPLTMQALRDGVSAGNLSETLQQALRGLAKTAGDDASTFVREVEGWFDAQMDRITGSYKRWAKRWVLVVAAVVVLACGVDSIAIAKTLYTQDAVLSAVAETAPAELCPAGTSPEQCSENAIAFFSEVGLPLGWSAPDPSFGIWAIPLKVIGLLLSIGAAGLGAPFWYKVLDRVGAIRNTGNRPGARPS